MRNTPCFRVLSAPMTDALPAATPLPAEVDVVVVGAGAAGIGAARRLMGRPGLSVLLLEPLHQVAAFFYIGMGGYRLSEGTEKVVRRGSVSANDFGFRILDADIAAVSSCPCVRGRNYLAA